MNKKELEGLVLDKTEEAYALVNSLGDEDGDARGYFRELHNFYVHPESKGIYLTNFKDFYIKSAEAIVETNEKDLSFYEAREKFLKRRQGINFPLGAFSLASAIFIDPIFTFPAVYFAWKITAMYSWIKKTKQDQKECLAAVEEAKKEKERLSSIDEKVLGEVLNDNKAVMEEYFEQVFSE